MSWNALNIGNSGINAARRAMEVVSENISNVNTDGYSRRRVELAVVGRLAPMVAEAPREVESGVHVASVTRLRDAVLDGSFRAQAAGVSATSLRAEVAARAEEVVGPVDAGLQDAMGEYWAAWERLSANPENLAARDDVLSSGERLATWMRSASQQLQDLKRLVTDRGTSVVKQINTYATQLADLNQQIGDAVFRGAAPNDLLDQRDVLIDKIARLTSVSVNEGADGLTNVYVGSFPLVDGVTPREIVEPNNNDAPVWGINGFPVDLSGELAAVHEAKTLTLPGIQSSLDKIANTLEQIVNDQHQAGVDLTGAPGGSFFIGASAADIQVDPTLTASRIAAGLSSSPADNRNALRLALLGSAPTPDGPVDTMLSTLVGQLGQNAASTEQMARVSASNLSSLDDLRASQTGVSIDEEFADLVRYQRAYEASARVMQVADEMLDKLINGTAV